MHELVEQCIVIQMSGHCMQYVIQELYYFSVAVLQGGLGESPPPKKNLLCPTPRYYCAWTIQNFINVLILELGYARAT